MKNIKIILGLVLLVLFAKPALADGAAIFDQAYAEDATGQLSFAQARELAFAPFTGTLYKGYTASAIWVRVRVIKPDEMPEVFLTVKPQLLDKIELYDPDTPNSPPLISGDRHPQVSKSGSLENVFALHFVGQTKEYWLRIHSTSTLAIGVGVFTQDALHRQTDMTTRSMDITTGLLVAFLCWSAGMFLTRRGDRVIFAFMIQQFLSLPEMLSRYGYLRAWFAEWPGAAIFDETSNFLIIITTSCTIWFHFELLKTIRPDPRLLKLLELLLAASLPVFALMIAGHTRSSLQLSMMIMAAAPFLMLAIAATAGRESLKDQASALPWKAIILFYGLFLLAMTNNSLQRLGIHQLSFLIDHQIITLSSAMLVLCLLQWRALRTDRLKLRHDYRLRQLRHKVSQKRKQLEEQSQFLSMLAHELKTPLSVLRIATSMSLQSAPLQQHSEKAILDITTIIDRCLKVFALDEAPSTPVQPGPCDIVEELEALRLRQNDPRIRISGSGLPGFVSDAGLFRVIAGNLLENAIKYGDPDEPVYIHSAPEPRRQTLGIAIEVINAPGRAGLPDPEKLFQKFYRARAAQDRSGAGLGLYIVKGLTLRLGGTIKYSHTSNRIRFKLWLPSLASS